MATKWILRFLMVMQASFKIPDIVIDHFLRCYLYYSWRFLYLPNTVYKAKKSIGVLLCSAIYTVISKSKHCTVPTVELALSFCDLLLSWFGSMFERPNFYTDCEKWRSRSSTAHIQMFMMVKCGEIFYITKVSRFFLNLETWG